MKVNNYLSFTCYLLCLQWIRNYFIIFEWISHAFLIQLKEDNLRFNIYLFLHLVISFIYLLINGMR